MNPALMRRLRVLGVALALMGTVLLILRDPITEAGWPDAAPPTVAGAFLLLAGLILLLVPGARRPV